MNNYLDYLFLPFFSCLLISTLFPYTTLFRSYAVLQVNFRGSTGYGKAYLNAGDRQWGGKMHTDLRDGPALAVQRSEEHTSELQSHSDLVCRLLLEKKNRS